MAVRFNAAGQAYTRPVTGLAAWTMCLWMLQVTNRGGPFALGKPNAAGATIFLSGGAALKCFDLGSNGGGFGNLAVSAGTWYRIAITVNGTNCSFYSGGVTGALTAASVNNIQNPAGTGQSWFLGSDSFDGDWLDGRLAAVKIWNAELTAAEVGNELTQYLPLRNANLIQSHPFLSAEATDYSGSGNTLSGGVGTSTEDGPPIPFEAAPSPGGQYPAMGGWRVTVSSTAIPISDTARGGGRILIKNTDTTNAVDLGDWTVAPGAGFPLAAGTAQIIPVQAAERLFAIRSGSADVVLALMRA